MSLRTLDLMRILQFGDSALPVGAFAFSNGLESAVQTGVVADPASLAAFVRTALRQAASGDGVGVVVAHRAACAGDLGRVADVDAAILRRKASEEARTMTTRMGRKLAEVAQRVMGDSPLDGWLESVRAGRAAGTYPAGLALVCAHVGLPSREAFAMHQYGVASMMLGAALRLMRIGHPDTQAILFDVAGDAEAEFAAIEHATLDDMHGFAPLADVLAAHHVRAHVRMFMN